MDKTGSSEPLTAGVDIGTQSVRFTLVRADGIIMASGSAPLSSNRIEGSGHEQNPDDWYRALADAIRWTFQTVHPNRLDGVAICSTSGTILLTDSSCRPLGPAVMYDDGRATGESAIVQQAAKEVWARLGYRMTSSFALPRLLWMIQNGMGGNAARVMHSADFVASRLAGKPVATDWSHALKTGYDLQCDRWPADVMDALGIPVELLPAVVRPGTVLGEVSRKSAEYTGLPEGTPIMAGMTDSCAAQIAAGALRQGSWNSVLGTTLALKGVTRDLLHDPNGAVYSHRHPDGGWLPGGASNTGAGIISHRYGMSNLDGLSELARLRGPSSTVMYPLVGEGERFPFVNPNARGFQLADPEDEADDFRAILDGVAYFERLCFTLVRSLGAEIKAPISLTGGGAKNRFWSQLRADVLGVPVTVPGSSEPSVGMAILARAGAGSVVETADSMVRDDQRYEPNTRHSEKLQDNYHRFLGAMVEREYIEAGLAEQARRPL